MKYKEEWFNDDDFWEQYAPVMFDDDRWAEVSQVADGVTRLAGLDLRKGRAGGKGPSVLDLCCGFGRITLELARWGFAATGVDITAAYLNAAREDAAHEGLEIEFIQGDVRGFTRENAFDAAVNLYNSFGFFQNPDDDLLFLQNAHCSLREGGALIIDVQGKEIAVRDYTEAEWFERAGLTVLTETMPVDSWGSIRNRWILLKNGTRREKVFVQRLYAASEICALLYKAGFSAVEIYGGWDERPYDQNADTLIAVGRR
ncbi:MAG: methyltransferase domain-containing protein [Treponema sp.]|nr:methyltransferase domain-containing protein [Treponema sp.]